MKLTQPTGTPSPTADASGEGPLRRLLRALHDHPRRALVALFLFVAVAGAVGGPVAGVGRQVVGGGRRGDLGAHCLAGAEHDLPVAGPRGQLGRVVPADPARLPRSRRIGQRRQQRPPVVAARRLWRAVDGVQQGRDDVHHRRDAGKLPAGGDPARLPVLTELVAGELGVARPALVVEGSAIGEHVAAQGATELVMDHFLAPRAAALLVGES